MGKHYCEVAPADKSYHGSDLLTYESDQAIEIGQVVSFEVKKKQVYGFVVKTVAKPTFKTKSLSPTDVILPKTSVELFNWIREYYPTSIGVISQHFLPHVATTKPKEVPSTPVEIKEDKRKITADQKKVIDSVYGNSGTHIVHGETGSGKTKVYIELAKKTLKKQLSVLILVPEISLSPQIYKEFSSVFGSNVVLTHSGLTPRQRSAAWHRVQNSTTPTVVIGPRSALFMPFKELGLVVVDEFHEGAYKQESSPYYHALRVAGKLSEIHKCPLVLGSGTPPINEYFWSEQKNIPILKMKKLSIKDPEHSKVAALSVDLSDQDERSSVPLLSQSLITAIKETLAKNEQVLIFLNKRGSSRAIVCQDCGWRSTCSRCDLPLTYHQDSHKLVCHTCGYSEKPPTSCPKCSSVKIVFKSPGTKSVASSLEKLFPGSVIARFDKDNLKAERLDSRHDEVASGHIDILVGTQVLSKGHDLPKLGLVGILQADSSLQFPDYTANERSYQMIRQLVGRVGRGHRAGKVVVQSFMPDNPVIQDALQNDWASFYDKEIAERRAFGFPPFFHLLKIEASRASSANAKEALDKVAEQISIAHRVVIVGPSPSFIERKNGKSHWQLIIKSKNRGSLVEIAKSLPGNYTVNLDPTHLL